MQVHCASVRRYNVKVRPPVRINFGGRPTEVRRREGQNTESRGSGRVRPLQYGVELCLRKIFGNFTCKSVHYGTCLASFVYFLWEGTKRYSHPVFLGGRRIAHLALPRPRDRRHFISV